MRSTRTASAVVRLAAIGGSIALAVSGLQSPAVAATATGAASAVATADRTSPAPKLTNLSHLDFLLDDVPLLAGVAGHSTYRQSSEPTARAPWVYADRQADGSFTRVGGGPITDTAKGWYAQGAFDADDISRAAVVYVRDWKQNGTRTSMTTAYELLRSLTYLQTSSGPNAGNVVLWQQSDGTLNPSAIPVEQPDPSDSAESFWLARTVWALGEGYAAFRTADPRFASFLQQRLTLSLGALERQSLAKFGRTDVANGVRVPSWLISGSASATAEAVLGLSAYAAANPADRSAATALSRYSAGIAALSSGGIGQWPFGALLPEANSPTFWHAWGGMAPAALSKAASVLHRSDLQRTAATDAAEFTAQLLASGGPVNGWTPTPADRTQIAYGVDSRVQGLLAVDDATHADGLGQLAGAQAAWYFGANPASTPVYDPTTGVCVDGIAGDGTVNRNCGAESAIHTQLTMLALDAHPAVAALATSLTRTTATDGLRVAEAESGALTGTASVVTPPSAWTGSANWSGGAYVQASAGDSVTIPVPALTGDTRVLPIVNLGSGGRGDTSWVATTGSGSHPSATRLGTSDNARQAQQGIAPTTVFLLPQTLRGIAPGRTTSLTASVRGPVQLDAVLLQPVVSHLSLTGPARTFDLYVNAMDHPSRQKLGSTALVTVTRYDSLGRLTGASTQRGGNVFLEPGGFTTVVPR